MLVLRGEMLYDLEAVARVLLDGVAPIAGEPVRDDEPMRRNSEPPADAPADDPVA